MSDYKQKNLVWYGMTNVFKDVCNCFSILNAYREILSQGKCFGKLYSDYAEITAKVIETEMILKIYRNDKMMADTFWCLPSFFISD